MKTPNVGGNLTPKGRRLSWVGITGAGLAVLWAGLSWAGVQAPEAFVSAVGTFAALMAGLFDT